MLRRHSGSERLWSSTITALKLARWYLLCLLLLLVFTAAGIRIASIPPTRSSEEVLISIPEGSSSDGVAIILRQNSLIRSRTAFNIVRHIGYEGRPFVAGTYRFRKNMTMFRIMEMLIDGTIATARVTFPEGFTIRQMAQRLEINDIVPAEEFEELASTQAELFGIDSPTGSLEGYLFPDTYQFPIKTKTDLVIRRMLENLDIRLKRSLNDEIEKNGMDLHEILTVASMIERETIVAEERPVVASVIYNRLKIRMPLQIDATILYAQGAHKARVLYRDLEVESPYNTYRNYGLPPGPIANPGLASIEAAVRPADTPYLFYVADGTGGHVFSETFDQHRANIRRVRGN